MAEIVNLSVFTNQGVSCNSADLLQQAFQDVVDDGDRDNQFVAFFKDDRGQHQTFRLTQEQAAALGLTFEVDPFNEDKTNEVARTQKEENILSDMQSVEGIETPEEESHMIDELEEIDQIDFPAESEWIQDDPGENPDDTVSMDPQDDHMQHEMTESEDDVQNRSVREFVLQQLQNLKMMNKKNTLEVQPHHQAPASIERSPVILPQSQYVIKPAQTCLKTAKNVQTVSSAHKLSIPKASRVTNVSKNSFLINSIQKSISTNGLSPQVSKNGDMTRQLMNGNSVSVTNQVNGQIQLSPIVKNCQNIQRVNQQFYGPLSKPPELVRIKSLVPNGKNTGSFIKSVSVPGQIVKTCASAVNFPTSQSKAANSQMIFKGKTVRVNPQDLKPLVNHNGIVRPQNQLSILKPQARMTLKTQVVGNKHNGVAQTTKLVKKMAITPSVERRIVHNYSEHNLGNNLMSNVKPLVMNNMRIKGFNKSSELGEHHNTHIGNSVAPVQIEEKSVNGADNLIQIVQQGHTFHSNQKLTQMQLKQIAHVLQQRGQQDLPASKEKVVYRVVFPEELDLRIRNPNNSLKGSRGKRGRPKKAPGRQVAAVRVGLTDEETEESKEDRKKVVARTRSGRLSRPPRHMVRDYKHLHPLDFMQPDLDDSDGGYSDYNTNTILNNKLETEGSKELLTGLDGPKRKVSGHFRCTTCNKIYLGRARLAKHFELFPDHGSLEVVPSSTSTPTSCPDGDLKKSPSSVDQFKRKGKKRGPWAYVTPEAKSERRQTKLREALSVCDSGEISKIAAKPVLNAQSLYDLLAIKSDNNVKLFLNELKVFMEKIREQAGVMLSPLNCSINKEKEHNVIELKDELLCDALGLVPGLYSINEEVFKKPEPYNSLESTAVEEPPMKVQKLRNDEGKENIEERLSSGFSESSDLSVSDFLTERKLDPNCPEVLTALTLMPRNPSPDTIKNNVSKLLISSPQIQRQISDNPGFQKVDINGSKISNFRKLETLKEGFTRLNEGLGIPTCSPVFGKLDDNYGDKMNISEQAFIKLEPIQQSFIKLGGSSSVGTYAKEDNHQLNKLENGSFDNLGDGVQSFTKNYEKMMDKIGSMNSGDCEKSGELNCDKDTCKITEGLPMLQDTVPIITTTCDTSIFGSTDNLDPIGHLDYSAVMDKHLMMDEKLVEQMHLVDQSNLVDELVSERLKNIIPDGILENNLIPNTTNLDTELDFEALSEEFNRNTRS